MQKRIFGKTGWSVSEIGYGAWGIGKRWWGPTWDSRSLKALKRAFECGINFYDTALVYGEGHSERLIAKAFKKERQNLFIATKIPPKNKTWPAQDVPCQKSFPEDWILQCTEKSLKNLKTDTIDLQQLHVWSDRWTDAEEWKKGVDKLKRSGKIRAFGISINDHDPDSAIRIVESGMVDSVQVIFNLFDHSPAEKLFPLCQKTKTAVIVRVPLDEGGLSGKLTPGTRFHRNDFRSRYFAGERLLETCERVEGMKFLIRGEIKTMAQAALKFCLSFPAVTAVIPGMRRPEHVEENTAVSDGRYFTVEELREAKKHAWVRNFYKSAF